MPPNQALGFLVPVAQQVSKLLQGWVITREDSECCVVGAEGSRLAPTGHLWGSCILNGMDDYYSIYSMT